MDLNEVYEQIEDIIKKYSEEKGVQITHIHPHWNVRIGASHILISIDIDTSKQR